MYGIETLPLILRKEHRLRAFQKKVLKIYSGLKGAK
jgi:hypothetical protein